MEKLCSRCNGREHPADVCPKSEEEAVLAMTGAVGARVDVGEDNTVQGSAFYAELPKQHEPSACDGGNVKAETRPSSQRGTVAGHD